MIVGRIFLAQGLGQAPESCCAEVTLLVLVHVLYISWGEIAAILLNSGHC